MNLKITDLKNIGESKKVILTLLSFIILSLIIIIGSFPNANNFTYGKGIDASLIWVFNHLFEVNWMVGRDIVFPHGPLAFFMYPTGDRIYLVMLAQILLKIFLFIAIYFTFEQRNRYTLFFAFVITYALSVVSGFNHLLLENIIFHYCAYYNTRLKYFKITAFILSSFALFIKAYVAIIAVIISLSYQLHSFLTHKKLKENFIDIGVLAIFSLCIWLFLYKSFDGFFHFLFGMMNLAGDNSSAASYYPDNNWIYLGMAIIFTGIFLLIKRDKRSIFFTSLITLSLFAAWKHGMAREDFYHQRAFIVFVFAVFIASIAFVDSNRIIKLFLGMIALLFLIANTQNSVNDQEMSYSINRSGKFYDFLKNFNTISETSEQISLKNAAGNKVPAIVKNIVNDSKIDIYPWEYSFIPVNEFHWEPRVVIQSYASYTHWLDQNNSSHFNSENAPEFILWEKKKVSSDDNGNDYSSIDHRYLLNDEPITLLSILSNYKPRFSNDRILLLQQLEETNSFTSNEINSIETSWGKWLKIPKSQSDLLRAKVHFDKTILQKLKSFLYKDEQFWMYIKLMDGRIHNYRIVPKNAEDGLWIGPYVFNEDKLLVDEIMFVNSNHKIISDKLKITWEEFDFTESNTIEEFFSLNEKPKEMIWAFNYNFEKSAWLKTLDSNEGINLGSSFLNLNDPPEYDFVFKSNLDSIEIGSKLNIAFEAWIMKNESPFNLKSSVVFTIESGDKLLLYKSIPLNNQIIDENEWNHFISTIAFEHHLTNSRLKIYILNPNGSNYKIKDLNISVF